MHKNKASMETLLPETRTADRAAAAQKIIKRRTLYAAGAGLLPVPVADAAAIVAIQLVMIRDLSRVYGQSFRASRVRAIITTLAGDVATLSVTKLLPGFGSVLSGLTGSVAGAASTYALGRVFSQHYAQGGTLLTLNPEASRAFYLSEFAQGIEVVTGRPVAADRRLQEEKTGLLAVLGQLRTALLERSAADLSDLEQIEGIGPKIAEVLKAGGISDLQALASAEVSQLQSLLEAAGSQFNTSVPDSWPEQARLAVAGETAALQALQAALVGGRAASGKRTKKTD